jgi:hypothetical protein
VRKENREKQICGCPPLTDQTLSSTTSRPRKPTMEHPNADEWTGLRLAPTKIETPENRNRKLVCERKSNTG